jgi:hypothetical protein
MKTMKKGFSTSINTEKLNKTQNNIHFKIRQQKISLFSAVDEKNKFFSQVFNQREEDDVSMLDYIIF